MSEPTSVEWLPTTFEKGPAECVARCTGGKFGLALISGDSCRCGDLRSGERLGLSTTTPPAERGSMQVVMLPVTPSTVGEC